MDILRIRPARWLPGLEGYLMNIERYFLAIGGACLFALAGVAILSL